MGYDMHMVEEADRDEGYFRANIWGMQMLRGAMKAAGVMDVDHEEVVWYQPTEEEQKADENAWEIKNAEVKKFRSKTANLVPIGKFCSNDGWHVVPEECLVIADGLDKLLATGEEVFYRDTWEKRTVSLSPSDLEFVKDFAEYCRKAAEKQGFTVW